MSARRRSRWRTASWSRSLRIRNRGLWLSLLVSAVLLGSSVLIMLSVSAIAGREAAARIRISDVRASDAMALGSGINLQSVKDLNLLQNPSFEDYTLHAGLSVIAQYADAEDEGVWIAAGEADGLRSPAALRGASYRIVSQEDSGIIKDGRSGHIRKVESWRPLTSQTGTFVLPGGTAAGQGSFREVRKVLPYTVNGVTARLAVGGYGLVTMTEGKNGSEWTLNSRTGEVSPGLDFLTMSIIIPSLPDAAEWNNDLFILSEEGQIFRSAKGIEAMEWSEIPMPEDKTLLKPGTSWKKLIASEHFLLAVGSNMLQVVSIDEDGSYSRAIIELSAILPRTPGTGGQIWTADIWGQELLMAAFDGFIYRLAFESSADKPFVTGELNEIPDAVVPKPNILSSTLAADYGSVTVNGDTAIFWTSTGDATVLTRSGEGGAGSAAAQQVKIEQGSRDSLIVSVLMPKPDVWLAVTSRLDVMVSDDLGITWNHYPIMYGSGQSVPAVSFVQFLYANGAYMEDQDHLHIWDLYRNVYTVPLATAFIFQEASGSGSQLQGGELLILEGQESFGIFRPQADQETGRWLLGSDCAAVPAENGEQDTWAGSQHVMLQGSEAYATQILGAAGDGSILSERELYSIRFTAEASEADGVLTATLSGPFPDMVFEFSGVGAGRRSYEQTFLAPRANSSADQDIDLTLRWSGQGSLRLDDVFLGQTIRQDNFLEPEFINRIAAEKPYLIRLGYAAIGAGDVAGDAWMDYGPFNSLPPVEGQGHPVSLEAALRLVKAGGANPWLVLDSFATEEDMENLIAYMAAPVTEAAGARRLENGTVVPWSRQFSLIILEIGDSEGIYRTDSERGAFVDYLLSALRNSPYYNEIKNQLVLTDAMTYNAGLMQSSADYHAAELIMEVSGEGSFADWAGRAYERFTTQTPRHLDRPGVRVPDLISSFRIDGSEDQVAGPLNLTAAQQVWAGSGSLGLSSSGVLFMADPLGTGQEAAERTYRIAGILGQSARGSRLRATIAEPGLQDQEISDTGSSATGSAASAGLRVMAFDDGSSTAIIVLNIGAETETFELDSVQDISGADMKFYSADGSFNRSQPYSGHGRRHMLSPGEVVVIVKTAQED